MMRGEGEAYLLVLFVLEKLDLHRTTAVAPQYPSLVLDFNFDNTMSSGDLDMTNSNQDTTLTRYTSANILQK
jgi:hypothetical protein